MSPKILVKHGDDRDFFKISVGLVEESELFEESLGPEKERDFFEERQKFKGDGAKLS